MEAAINFACIDTKVFELLIVFMSLNYQRMTRWFKRKNPYSHKSLARSFVSFPCFTLLNHSRNSMRLTVLFSGTHANKWIYKKCCRNPRALAAFY
jgi:hypothetical protein